MLSRHIIKTITPSESICNNYIDNVDYCDAFMIEGVDTKLSAQEAYIKLFSNTPKWISNLIKIRDKLMSVLGFKTVIGAIDIDAQMLSAGSKVGMFEIYHVEDSEVIAGEKDKHLDFIVSVLKHEDKVTVSTLVKYQNVFGKAYMTLISPFHKFIVKRIMKNLI